MLTSDFSTSDNTNCPVLSAVIDNNDLEFNRLSPGYEIYRNLPTTLNVYTYSIVVTGTGSWITRTFGPFTYTV